MSSQSSRPTGRYAARICAVAAAVLFGVLAPRLATSGAAQANISGCVKDAYGMNDAQLQVCGFRKYPLEQTFPLGHGGTAYVYHVDGVKTEYDVPPHSFHAATASAAQLAEYNYPPRPSTEPELTQWLGDMAKDHPITPGAYLVGAPHSYLRAQANSSPATNAVPNTTFPFIVYSQIWGGYVADNGANNGNHYNEAFGQYNEPQALSTTCKNPPPDETTWVGLGGWNTNKLAQAGTDVNFDAGPLGTTNHAAWTEVLPDQNFEELIPGLTADPGYRFTVQVNWYNVLGGYFQFYLQNSKTGNSSKPKQFTSNYDGTTAEFVGERPTSSHGYINSLLNFSYLTWKFASVNGTMPSNALGFEPLLYQVYMNTQQDGSGKLLAHPGSIYNNGQQFNEYWDACG